jgi:hypothetical protein
MARDRQAAQARRFGHEHPYYKPRRPPAPNTTLRVGLVVRYNFWFCHSPHSYKFRERKMESTDDDFKCSKLAEHAAHEYLKQVLRWDDPVPLKNRFRPPPAYRENECIGPTPPVAKLG